MLILQFPLLNYYTFPCYIKNVYVVLLKLLTKSQRVKRTLYTIFSSIPIIPVFLFVFLQRKQKQALTPVTFLAGFSEQCFDKLKELRKKEDAPRTPSVFNSFRKWGEAERLHALGIYQLEGKQSFQRHCRKAQAKVFITEHCNRFHQPRI